MTAYKAPLREYGFLLNELLDYNALCQLPGFEDATSDMVDAVLGEAAKLFENVLAPTNQTADQQGTKLENKAVVPAPVLDGIYQQLVEGGWLSLSSDPDFGGQGFPELVGVAVEEMMQSANMAFSLAPMLTRGVVASLRQFGSVEQQQKYLPKLISGEWAGTMQLTESQAGSDLAAIKTRAVPEGDHYRITGSKIFITWGDQPYTDNIIHLVLARTPDAPEGTKGISMFIVPKFLDNGERNDNYPVSVEHKMGIHASPTCVMSFGDEGGAIGYLVGEENKGLMYMFATMNAARLSVGQEGISTAERAYQQAVAYAKDRVQGQVAGMSGKAAIINHADVKRMLMKMRALIEAGRALSFAAIRENDISHHHPDADVRANAARRVEVFTPIVKAWGSEAGSEVTSLGVQVHGGMGFVEETGAAQHMRDVRIAAIYEGTNGIQALDLVGRKTLRDGGEGVRELLGYIKSRVAEVGAADTKLAAAATTALESCDATVAIILDNVNADPHYAGSVAFNYLMQMGTSVAGALLIVSGLLAQQQIDAGSSDPFYRQKVATAKFYAAHLLPHAEAYAASVRAGFAEITALGEEDFDTLA